MKTYLYLAFVLLVNFLIIGCDSQSNLVTTGEKTIVVRFDANGGSEVESLTMNGNYRVNMPADPIKDGFIFSGWYWDNNTFIEPFTSESLLNRNTFSDVTIYAKWDEIEDQTVEVSFDSMGGESIDTQLIEKGDTVLEPEISRQGYRLDGWYTSLNNGQTFEEKWSFSTDTVSNDLTLYAKWQINQYTVSYETNGGTPIEPITQNYQTYIYVPNDPIKEGYTFDGWYSDSELTNLYTFNTMPAEDLVLYAKWEINDYTITYYDFDDRVIYQEVFEYNSNISHIEVETPIREGHTFIEWDSDLPSLMPASDLDVKARYEINQYTISFISNGGTGVETIRQDYHTDLIAPDNPFKVGYTFDGWYSDSGLTNLYAFNTMPAEDLVLYAKWIVNSYHITFSIYEDYNPISDVALSFGEIINQISLGSSHSSALSSNGRVFTWGLSNYGQLGDGFTDFQNTPIEISNQFELGLDEEIVQVSMGGNHSSALSSNGRVFTWGSNEKGELGDGTRIDRYVPIDITSQFDLNDDEIIISISLGSRHSSALSSKGRIFTWGENLFGQVGDGTIDDRDTPIDITSQFDLNDGETIVSVSLGHNHSSVLTSDGRVFTWGYNYSGQLGDGATSKKTTPVDITDAFELNLNETIVYVSMNVHRSSAITSQGRVFTWGNNEFGQLGDGTRINRHVPIDITSQFTLNEGEIIVSISYASALSSENRVFTWGRNNSGQIGDGTMIDSSTPKDITNQFNLNEGEVIVSVASISGVSSATTSDGRIFTWGRNLDGQLANGTFVYSHVPALSSFKLSTIIDVITYDYNELVLPFTPVKEGYSFDGWYKDAYLTTRYDYSYMPENHMALYARWIINQYQISFESNGGSMVASIVQDYHTLVIEPIKPVKEGYTFDGWYMDSDLTIPYTFSTMPGDNIQLYAKWMINQYEMTYLEYEDYDPLKDIPLFPNEIIKTLELGFYYSSAITTRGRLFTWGYNSSGQLGDGTRTDRLMPTDITKNFNLNEGEKITSVSLGRSHSAAITSEGRIFTWGDNMYGQLGDTSTTDRYTPYDISSYFNLDDGETIIDVSLGLYHSSAISSNGRIFMWGDNRRGQLGNGINIRSTIPIDITSMLNLSDGESVSTISLGDSFSIALTSEGRIFTWGTNAYGQLGDGTTLDSYSPKDISDMFNLNNGDKIVFVSIGLENASAITLNGSIYMWGRNHIGQLGDGTTVDQHLPVDITGRFNMNQGEIIVSSSLGWIHSSALSSEGRIFTWGSNGSGKLGDGTTTNRLLPTDISNQFDFSQADYIQSVKLGYTHSAIYTSNGKVFIWGHNYKGQIGDGTTTDRQTPYEICFVSAYSLEEIIYDFSEDIIDLIPIREGYTFDGWYLDSTMTNHFDLSNMPAEGLILYGRWLID